MRWTAWMMPLMCWVKPLAVWGQYPTVRTCIEFPNAARNDGPIGIADRDADMAQNINDQNAIMERAVPCR